MRNNNIRLPRFYCLSKNTKTKQNDNQKIQDKQQKKLTT